MKSNNLSRMDQRNITEASHNDSIETIVALIKTRLKHNSIPENTTLDQLETIVDELAAFGFGRQLLKHRAISGLWTQYMVLYPDLFATSGLDPHGKPQTDFERWILTHSPTILATQERFKIFQKITQDFLQDGMTLASIPCGLMDDLFRLDFTKAPNANLIGIDIDPEAINFARQAADKFLLSDKTQFIQSSAWNTPLANTCDLITSNGLTIYEANEENILELYQHFLKVLKPGGMLITSFLTPPPMLNKESPWDMNAVDPEALPIQRLVFVDILNAQWQHYRMEKDVRAQLEHAGFEKISFTYDQAKLFPTVCAFKP